uniref:Ovule protein n=1 Tax=Caenorhabditis tropicalis TaxID=1561998 RepID=A0A1I7TY68_9PELO
MDVLRRIMPRKMKRDQYSFELLKSSSNIELSTGVGPGTPLPRNFSHYDSIRIAPSSQSTVRRPPVCNKVRILNSRESSKTIETCFLSCKCV